jgi:uncharacterized protein YicC (UPF0701 family)
MNSQEAIILMMAQKLRSCDEQEMRQLCSQTPEAGQESPEAIFQTIDRWAKLDKATQQKILSLIEKENIQEQVHKLKAHINQLMETQKNRAGDHKEKGQ